MIVSKSYLSITQSAPFMCEGHQIILNVDVDINRGNITSLAYLYLTWQRKWLDHSKGVAARERIILSDFVFYYFYSRGIRHL